MRDRTARHPPDEGSSPRYCQLTSTPGCGFAATRDRERLRECELAALAAAYYEAATARSLLERAGVEVERQPTWAGTPLTYWREVGRLMAAGLAVDGRGRLLRAATRDFPANPVFAPAESTDPCARATAVGASARPRKLGAGPVRRAVLYILTLLAACPPEPPRSEPVLVRGRSRSEPSRPDQAGGRLYGLVRETRQTCSPRRPWP